MTIPSLFADLSLPVIAAPMFIVSSPELVIAQCRAGIVGTFPSLNARPASELARWLVWIKAEVATPYGVNLIVHQTNARLAEDLATCAANQVPLIITSVGAPGEVVAAVHGYGGLVFHDVTTMRHAKRALADGVDGLILVSAGAGGHAGTLNPFALVAEVRQFYDGPVVLSGAISTGAHIRASQVMGADLAYMGTRFIATVEANAAQDYKQMLVKSTAADVVFTSEISGIPANFLRASLSAAGFGPDRPGVGHAPDLSLEQEAKAWKDIWSAGQGVGSIHDVPSVAELVTRLKREYKAAL